MRLRELFQWGVIDRFQPFVAVGTAPMHYVLAPAGAAVLAAEDGRDVKELGYRHDRAFGIAHSLRLAHTVGVNGWFTALVDHGHTVEFFLEYDFGTEVLGKLNGKLTETVSGYSSNARAKTGAPSTDHDPTYAATQFYQHLRAIPGWQQMSVNDAAQGVQRSGFPNAYAQHEQAAREIVATVSSAHMHFRFHPCGTTRRGHNTAPNPSALIIINDA